MLLNQSDAVICNGPRLAEFRRKRCGLTQQQLANDSELSERTVRKAERGEPVRVSSLEALVQVFQKHDQNVAVDDFLRDPVEIARAFVEAYREHEVDMVQHIRHLLSDDLEVFISGDPALIPFAGTYHGPDGLQEFWNRFFAVIRRYDKQLLTLDYIADGDRVGAFGYEVGGFHSQPVDFNNRTWLCLKFTIRAGLITRFEDYFDTGPATEAIREFGLPAEALTEGIAKRE